MKNKLSLCLTIPALVVSFAAVTFAAGSYYPVYNTPPPANEQPATQNTVPAPQPAYYNPNPYYAPTYYGPVASFYRGPFDPALAPWRWNFDFGGGPTAEAGSHGELKNGSNFTVGGGYNFTQRTGLVLEFMQSDLDLTDQNLAEHSANDGSASVWGVTLGPIWRYKISGVMGGYIIGGGGYYEREEKYSQGPFGYPYYFGYHPAGYVTRDYDDAGGVNLGLGFTFNVGWGTKLFVEARYHYIFTPGTGTQVIPVTFGFRW